MIGMLGRWIVGLVLPGLALGCSTQPLLDLGVGGGDGDGSGGAGAGVGGSAAGGSAPVSDAGLPCDVSFLLVQYCRGCHSQPPIAGAATSLMTYEDLIAPMPGDASTTVAEESLARMLSTSSPMPPGVLLSSADVAPFAAWVDAGMPAEVCASDGTVPDDPQPMDNPYDDPAVCTSGEVWSQGDEGSPDMTPGRACIACHSDAGDDGPRFSVAGTLYPTAHEPDDCNGTGGAQVEITDADGQVLVLEVRSSGNFYLSAGAATLAMPITARVLQGDQVLPMLTPVMTGDCNTCHTQEGKEGAPGRVILPW